MTRNQLQRALDVLYDDYHRQSQYLTYDQFVRTATKRELAPEEVIQLAAALEQRGVQITVESCETSGRREMSLHHRGRRLSGHDEIVLGRRIQQGRLAEMCQQRETPSTPPLILRLSVRLGREAERRMIEANTGLVATVARQFCPRSGPGYEDALQDGLIGLVRAVHKFDPDRGARFSTYAVWWIKQAILRGLQNKSRTIRIPVHVQTKMAKLRKAQRRLLSILARPPSKDESAQYLGWDVSEVDNLEILPMDIASLEPEQSEDKAESGLQSFPADEAPSAEEQIFHYERRVIIEEMLSKLSTREAAILRLRYGFEDGQAHTLEELGARFDCTREWIRQLEARAFKKILKHKWGEALRLEEHG